MNESAPIVDFEQRVRERAYELWVQEGRPSGRDAEHWLRSEEATRAELAAAALAKMSKPKAAPRKKASAPRRARPAAALTH
jgi:hypothetical protein